MALRNKPSGGATPSAPSAPGLGGQQTANGNQYVAPMVNKKMLGTDKKGPAGRTLVSGGLGGAKTPEQRKRIQAKKRIQKQDKAAYKIGKKPAPKFEGIVDPRDSAYWNNTAALNNVYGNQVAGSLLDQTLDDNALATNTERMTTDRERSRRRLAESLLGTGGIRSGSHRRDQTEGDQDYQENVNRLQYDYGNAKSQRGVELAGYKMDRDQGYKDEYQSASDRKDAELQEQAASGAGNSSQSIQEKVKASNKRIKSLRGRVDDAKSDKQKAKLQEKIKEARKERTRLVKRYRKKNG